MYLNTMLNKNLNINLLITLGVVPKKDNKIKDIFKQSINNTDLEVLDYMNIRDLLELSSLKQDIPITLILMCMFITLKEGSLCLDIRRDSLENKFRNFLSPSDAKNYSYSFIDNLNNGLYSSLITSSVHDFFPVIHKKTETADYLYFYKFFHHEYRVINYINSFLNTENIHFVDDILVDKTVNTIVTTNPILIQDGVSVVFDKKQKTAIRSAINAKFTIISGGPGTGKTMIMVNILRCLVRTGVNTDNILLAAPTGRAARNMTEAIQKYLKYIINNEEVDNSLLGLKGSTVHNLLKYNKFNNSFRYDKYNQLKADVIILDEVSMIDISMMDRLLQAINPVRTRIILIGDKDQLPSVDAGSVMSDIIPFVIGYVDSFDKKDILNLANIVILEKSYRNKGNILKLSNSIKDKNLSDTLSWSHALNLSEALNTTEGECRVIEPTNKEDWRQTLRLWLHCHYLNNTYRDLIVNFEALNEDDIDNSKFNELLCSIYKHINKIRVLTILRYSLYGCNYINSFLADLFSQSFSSKNKNNISSGTPIIILQNDYKKELYNGDIGVLLINRSNIPKVYFKKTDGYVGFPLDSLPLNEVGFATTVHKSQGSEFDDILLVLPDKKKYNILTKEIIYTGITRAKHRVFIYGKQNILDYALSRKIERESGFI